MTAPSNQRRINSNSFSPLRGVRYGTVLHAVTGGAVNPTPTSQTNSLATQQIQGIIKALNDIVKILDDRNRAEILRQERQRRFLENQRRRRRELQLERGRGETRKIEIPKKITAPVISILGKIWNFIKAVFLGKVLIKLIEWFSDKKNKDKVDSIVRFLKDHWPKLLSLYLIFGTSLGKFVRGIVAFTVISTRKLIAAAARLAAGAGLKGAGRIARFVGGPKGRLIAGAIEVGAIAVGTIATSKAIEGFTGINGKEPPKKSPPPPPTQKFSGGGLAQLKNILGFFGGSLVNSAGKVVGQSGIDKVPAMLTAGEFVINKQAVSNIGVENLEALNSAYGGASATNRPRKVSGRIFAAGGGYVGDMPPRTTMPRGLGGSHYLAPSNVRTYFPAAVSSRSTSIDVNPRIQTPSINVSNTPEVSSPTSKVSSFLEPSGIAKTGMKLFNLGLIAASIYDDIELFKQKRYKDAIRNTVATVASALASQAVFNAFGAASAAQEIFSGGVATPTAIATLVGGTVASVGTGMATSRATDFALRKMGLEDVPQKFGRKLLGGKLVGGYGLKQQSFEEMPKTQLMTDDKGRLFVGHKARKGNRVVYIRGKNPAEDTKNIFEQIGRFINPGAYKKQDELARRDQYLDAALGSISSLRARGASRLTIARQGRRISRQLQPPERRNIRVVHRNSNSRNRFPALPRRGRPNLPNISASNPSRHGARARNAFNLR